MQIALLLAGVLAVIWVGWRLGSRRALLPCPAEFAWLVEIENPLARATRSEHVVQQLALPPGARVMDVGCGPGRVTLPLARAVGAAGEVIAFDVQAAMLAKVAAKARAAGLANIRPVPADAGREPVPAGSLDAAVMVMMLGEVPEQNPLLGLVHAALKPGGHLLIAESVFDPHYLRRRRVRAMAASAGFTELGMAGNFFGYAIVFGKAARP
jgi:ubiquinone/menaquinone biosynthesis C-methylase UbiE